MSSSPYLLDHLDYRYCQVFGESCDPLSIPKSDHISALTFSDTGEHIAVGDYGGRIIVFSCTTPNSPPKQTRNGTLHPSIEYDFLVEFRSHVAEYDHMRSLDVQARITSINFLTPLSQHLYFLAANDNDIKLWRIRDLAGTASPGNYGYTWDGYNKDNQINSVDDLRFPTKTAKTESSHPLATKVVRKPAPKVGAPGDFSGKAESRGSSAMNLLFGAGLEDHEYPYGFDSESETDTEMELVTEPMPGEVSGTSTVSVAVRKNFTHASNYHINTVLMSPGSEQFIVADDFSITRWWVESTSGAHMLVDMRPCKLSDVIETICTADLEPTTDSLIAFGTNYGKVKCIDQRQSAICDNTSLVMAKQNPIQIESVKFLSPTTVAARDLLDLCIYDIRNPKTALSTYAINFQFSSELVQSLYCDPLTLYDSFNMTIDRKRQFIATGSYNSQVQIYNLAGTAMAFKVAHDTTKQKRPRVRYPGYSVSARPLLHDGCYNLNSFTPAAGIQRMLGIRHLAYHPCDNVLAIATIGNLFIYASVEDADAGFRNFSDFCEECGLKMSPKPAAGGGASPTIS